MTRNVTAAAAILAITLPAVALAETSVKMDADGDGSVTMNEFNAAMPDAGEGVFTQIDANADGTLSAEEITAAREAGVLPAMSSEG